MRIAYCGSANLQDAIRNYKSMSIVRLPQLVGVIERGTGQTARIEVLKVFGKSGTVQKTDPLTGLYSATRYVSSFACGDPADDPQAVVLVSVNVPTAGSSYYGGTVAAPVAAEILRRTLLRLDDALTTAPHAGVRRWLGSTARRNRNESRRGPSGVRPSFGWRAVRLCIKLEARLAVSPSTPVSGPVNQ